MAATIHMLVDPWKRKELAKYGTSIASSGKLQNKRIPPVIQGFALWKVKI